MGIEMHRGQSMPIGSHLGFRDWLMPVVAIDEDGQLKVNGTAVCIGAGTFVTARHVVDYLLDERPEGADAGVWVAWTEGELTDDPRSGCRGQLMAVTRYRKHERVDLAILTTVLPSGAVGRHTTVPWTLRMLGLDEPLLLLGYPSGSAEADITADGPANVVLEYPLMVGLGAVTGHRDGWGDNPKLVRSWPGIETDAPMPSAMSGGAVIDRYNRLIGFSSSSQAPLPPELPDWNGYVSMAGFLLDMDVDVPHPGGLLKPQQLADLIQLGEIPCLVDEATFEFDPVTGPTYRFPPMP